MALISATALAYEILLTRLFSIVQWHHFAYMVISIALLGFGASGTFLALKSRLVQRFVPVYIINLALCGISVLPCFLLAQQLAVHPEQLLWDPAQMIRVTAVYLLLALPFFFAANAIGLALMCFHKKVPQVYSADLIGAGLGCMAIIGLLYLLFPIDVLKVLSVLGFLAIFIAGLELHYNRICIGITIISVASLLIALSVLPSAWLNLSISPYKSITQQLQVMGAYVEHELTSPLGMLSIIASPTIPLRHAPGLSLNASVEVPEQRGIYIDGEAITPIDADNNLDNFAYLESLTSALPYYLKRPNSVVVLGAGGGNLVRQALTLGASSVTAVELDPQIIKLMREDYREFSGGLYDLNTVNVQIMEARSFFDRNPQHYDLIQVSLIDSFAASSAGLYALNENYLYTVEALGEYFAHLSKGGYLSISRWIKLPPRDALKLFATAVEALRRAGISDPAKHLMLIRGWQTSTLLIKNGEFTREEILQAQNFCDVRAFDLAFYDNMPETLANRNNVLPEPYFFHAAQALLSETSEQYQANYKFNIKPTTDDRPYFFYFFKWRTLPEIISLRGKGGVPLLEAGYLILIATLFQAFLISIFLIILPMRKRLHINNVRPGHMLGYFVALGLAYLFIEIAFIQKFLLFLNHPVLTVAIVLGGFLVFSGMGSYLVGYWRSALGSRQILITAITIIGIFGSLYAVALPSLVFEPLIGAPIVVKLAVSLILIGVLAIPMGMPFPLGVTRLSGRAENQIPVAWAINGCASVISAILATVIAIQFGFATVVLIAVVLYIFAATMVEF